MQEIDKPVFHQYRNIIGLAIISALKSSSVCVKVVIEFAAPVVSSIGALKDDG